MKNNNLVVQSERANRDGLLRLSRLASLAVIVLAVAAGASAQGKRKTARPVLKQKPPVVETDVDSRNTEFVRPRRTADAPSATPSTTPPIAPTAATTPALTPAAPSAAPSDSSAVVKTADPKVREEEELAGLRDEVANAEDEKVRASARRKLVDRLVEMNRTPEAIKELRAITDEERLDPVGLYNVGNTLARLGDEKSAVEAYRKAISQRRGNYSRAQNNLGVVLIRLGRLEEAHDALEAALRQEAGNYGEASYNMGRLQLLRDELPLAIKSWERTLKLEPDHTPAVVALARAYAQKGDAERGLELLDAFSKRMSVRGRDVPREVTLARGEVIALGNIATK
ncbi:MAG: tetratricopeptide repeat protein [Pyrinomonadaceae bacterium]